MRLLIPIVFLFPAVLFCQTQEDIFIVTEKMPFISYPGCEHLKDRKEIADCMLAKIKDFVSKNLEYPELAMKHGVSGVVVVRFTIDKEGHPVDAEILRDIGAGCGKEVLRLMNLLGIKNKKWDPNNCRSGPNQLYFHMPVRFEL